MASDKSAIKGRGKTIFSTILGSLVGVFTLFLMFSSIHSSGAWATVPERGVNPGDKAFIQFSVDRHVIGFSHNEMVIAGADHALRVKFLGAHSITPESGDSGENLKGKKITRPLDKVIYPGLWDGVDLVYEKDKTGVVKSTFYIAEESEKKALKGIRLAYNAPVSLDKEGRLHMAFEQGEMIESQPIAWQMIDDRQVPVRVAYEIIGEREVGFHVENYNPAYPLVIDPVTTWNTYMGSEAGMDDAWVVAVDSSGNVYVTGRSSATWGSPVEPYSGDNDIFVTKLDSNGNRVWNTFMGSVTANDRGYGLAIDSSGNVYVSGYCEGGWGTPVDNYTGGNEAWAAKLDNDGNTLWNTFMGSAGGRDRSRGIAVDTSGNVYVMGYSDVTWGSPLNAFTGENDTFVAKLDSDGNRLWNTFMGSAASDDYGWNIDLDSSGNAYVVGRGNETWGTPVNAFSGVTDVFIAKLGSSGTVMWNTFMGSSTSIERGTAIAVDSSGNAYVTGYSDATWGTPVNAYSGSNDVYVAKLDSNGNRLWNTFMGSAGGNDTSWNVDVDSAGNIYVGGYSNATWGSPEDAYTGGNEAFVARLDNDGNLIWNTFMGSAGGDDRAYGLTVDTVGNVYAAGYTTGTWGAPVDAFSGVTDAFTVKISDVSVSSTNCTISGVTVRNTTAVEPINFETKYSVEFTATGVSGNASVSLTFPFLPDSPQIYKVINGVWKMIYPVNETTGISGITLAGNVLNFTILDNSDSDSDLTIGTVNDPLVIGNPENTVIGGASCFISSLLSSWWKKEK